MAKIQVFKHGTDTHLGKGDGSVDNRAQTATITQWIDKAAVLVGTSYMLRSGGKTYDDANCTQAVLPVAFDNVV